MRKLKLFFACLLMAVLSIGQMWGAETQFSWAGSSTAVGGTTDYVVSESPITLTFAKGSNNNAPRTNKEGAVRMYSGTTLTISSTAGNITRVVFTPTTNSYQATNLTYNSVALTGNDWTLETPAASVTLTATENARFKTIVVHTADGSDPVAVTGVTLDQSEAEVAVGKTITLIPTIAPSGATNKAVTWESDDEDIATVANGVVTGVAEGSTTITVTTEDGSFTADCEVTVTAAPAAVNYEKVTAEPADWSGEYLLVYEADATKARVWKGADQANYYAEAAISNGVIAAPDDAAVLTIAKVAESDPVVYTIMVGDKYIGQTSDANGIKIQTTAINNSISYNGTDAAVDIVASSAHLRYNNASSSYFRYYKSATYSSQNKIQLYKKVEGAIKPEAGLAYAAADAQKLVKVGGTLEAPTLTNPNTLTVSYASSDEAVVKVNASTGAITEIAAAGKAVITASFAGNDDFFEDEVSYTIFVAEQAGTEADPLTEASAKALIDLGCTVTAHVNGVVASATYNSTYKNYGVTLTNGFQFYHLKDLNNADFSSGYLKINDELTAVGALKKYNSTYELDEGCYLTSYVEFTEPLISIANTKETAYTVAQALAFATAPTTYDLADHVYIQGVVYDVKNFNSTNGTYDIYIKDASVENKFEFHNCKGLYQEGDAVVPFENGDVQVGNIVIGYGVMTYYSGGQIWEFNAGDNHLVDLQAPVTGIELDATAEVEEGSTVNLTATILPSNTTGTIVWSVQSGSDYASVAAGVVTGKAEGEAVIRATVEGTAFYAECTVTVTAAAAPDTRKIANGPAAFTTTSGNLTPADIAYTAYQGGASTAPAIYNDGIRLYQISGSNDFGGFVTLTAKAGCTIDEVQITTTSKYATTVAYSKDGNETLLKSESVAASSSYTTGTGLNASSVNILNLGTGSDGRLEIASIKVYYTGEAATIDHYELGGTYQTAFMQDEEFNHTGLIVYAVYDALGENKVDITSMCTFSEPDMSTTGEKTIEITYNEAVVISYTINVAADSRKVAESPATFTAVSGDMNPADITFAAKQGGASTAPANYNDGIRLYQAPSADVIGGFITLKAKKGCTIDQVKITTTNSYATTVAYSVDGNENLLGSESVAKSSDYSTPSGLNVESVNIVNKGTGSSGRLEIASIKVWYTGDALPVHHYILGGTYATEFEQYGAFSYEGLTVTAAYDELETITEAVTGFTVEADLSTAGEKKAEVMLNSVKIAEYDITVTASAKVDPELAYNPASVILTKGDALSAPVLSNEFVVSPISFVSDKPAVATVDAEGNISLAGGIGVAVITASFAGNDDYLASEATFTITVNEPAEDLSGTWVVATSIAAGDRIIIADVAAAGAVYTMGGQNSNNRAAVASTVDEYGVLTPAEGTKTFLVVDAENGEFALQALNDNYLYAASTSSNHLKETSDINNVNAKWTITIENGIATIKALHEGHTSRNWMRKNSSDAIFSCYGSGQNDIVIYKIGTPDYGSYQRNVTSGNYGTICLPKAGVISGATLFEIANYENDMIYVDEILSGEMVAGRPYIFQATSDQLNVVYSSAATEETAGNHNGLYGFYNLSNENAQYDIPEDAGNYILYQNAYWLVSGREAYIANYRAYIKLGQINNTGAQAPGRRRVAMTVHGEQVVTGIDAFNAAEAPVKVMINGQIFILRGEKMYDATGRLVK